MAPRMRIDAARNYVEILAAGRRVVAQSGPDVALEQVAAEAGAGIATLYRRFPDRGTLLTALAVEALEEAARAARSARAVPQGDGLDAVGRYLDAMLHSGAAAVVPALVDRPDVDRRALATARRRSSRAVNDLVARAHADGSLPSEVSAGDVGVLLVRLSRPLPGALSEKVERELQRRHLAITMAGLRHVVGLDVDGPSFERLAAGSDHARAARDVEHGTGDPG